MTVIPKVNIPPSEPVPFDLFQSYSHLDLDPAGWAATFHDDLLRRIWNITNPHLNLNAFYDARNRDLNSLPVNIAQALDRTLKLLVIYSPSYIQSEWCRLERAHFLNLQEKEKIYKVVKYATPNDHTPDELSTQYEYKFYKKVDGVPIEMFRNDPDYLLEITRLALDLIRASEAEGRRSPIDEAPKNTVFLAETAPASNELRVKLLNELRAHKVNVLPNEVLSNQEKVRAAEVRKMIDRSDLSLHIIGLGAGALEQAQLEVARKATTNGHNVKIWIARDVTQSDFVKPLMSDEGANDAFDITIGSFETFKINVAKLFIK